MADFRTLRVTEDDAVVGLDVRLAIAGHRNATLGERFALPQLLCDKISRGELEHEAGCGCYT